MPGRRYDGGDEGSSHERFPDGHGEVGRQPGLDHIADRSCGEGFLDEFPIFVNGEEDNSGLRTFTLEPTRSLQAVEDRHRDVKNHNIRVEFGRGLKERLAVLDSVDNVELRL